MIQRIQTIYLLLAIALCIAAVYVPIPYAFTNGSPLDFPFTYNEAEYIITDVRDMVETQKLSDTPINIAYKLSSLPFYLFFSLASILSLFAIFRFKKQKRQIKLAKWSNFFIILVILTGIAYVFIDGFQENKDLPYFAALFPVFTWIFNKLAQKGIKKDKKVLDDMYSGRLR